MRVSSTKTAVRVERNVYLTSKKIKGYGKDNDYPQKVLEIVNSSGTGKTCYDITVKFVEGGGFTDETLANTVLNSRGERANSLLRKCAKDLTSFNGFAVLVKYNALGMPAEYFNIPFEFCRLEISANKEYTGRIAVYPDWTGLSGKQFKQNEVKYINRFNPDTVEFEMREAGSIEAYLGQIMYFTADGDFEYPVSPFDSVVTDMLTEESVSTVKHRNAKYNFLPAGILVRKGKKMATLDNGAFDETDPANQEMIESAEAIKKMQGDENASKIWVVDIDADEEKPEFIPFASNNYDRTYELTEKTVQDNIGRKFMIPPILRGVDIGAGFGADLMTNAYNFMNSITGNDRRMLEIAFKDLLEYYMTEFTDFSVKPLEYESNIRKIDTALLPDLTQNERRSLAGYDEIQTVAAEKSLLAQTLGVGGTQAFISIINDPNLTPEQKINLIIKLFSLTEDEAKAIVEK
jgi:hypothetical protein